MAVQHLQGWTGEYLCLICWNQKQVSSSFCTDENSIVISTGKKNCSKISYSFPFLFFFFFFLLIRILIHERRFILGRNKEVGMNSVDQTKNTRKIVSHILFLSLEPRWKKFGSQRRFYFSDRGEHIHLSRLSDSSMPLQELPSHSQRFSMLASPCSSAYNFDLQVAGYCMRHTVENPMPRPSFKQLISLYTLQYISLNCSDCVHMSWSEATENF